MTSTNDIVIDVDEDEIKKVDESQGGIEKVDEWVPTEEEFSEALASDPEFALLVSEHSYTRTRFRE